MLAAHNRMRRSDDFRRTMRQGRRVGAPTLVVHRWAGDDPSSPRVGLVVSRAVGSSVTRHTVSRRLRHLVRERLALLGPGELLVVRATPHAASASSSRLAHDLESCLRRTEPDRGGGRATR